MKGKGFILLNVKSKYVTLSRINRLLDRGSIRSSPSYGLSTPCGLTKEQYWTVPPCIWS